jgi:hypothetical protein
MAEKWDKQLMDFLKRTGDELKRTTDDLRGEAQRLLKEVKDPQNQTKVKEGLEQLRTWATVASKVAAEKIETAVHQVEGAVERAFKPEEGGQEGTGPRVSTATPPPQAPTPAAPASTAPTEAPKADVQAAKKAAPKSIGRKKAAAKSPSARPAAKTAKKGASNSKKTIGRTKKPTAGA